MEEYKTIGKALERKDARAKVRGLAKYTGDYQFPDMLYGVLLYSRYAYARILKIDTAEAEKMPGVEVIVTGKDYPQRYGSRIADRPVFASDVVRFTGEPVAAVAAETEEIAREAAKRIVVEYEPLEPILDPLQSMADHEHLLHPELETYWKSGCKPVPSSNICAQYHLQKGNVEKGFAEAEYVIEGTYRTPAVQHGFLEPHITIAKYDIAEDRLVMWDSTVAPFNARNEISSIFQLPVSQIKILLPAVGGSFGAKMYAKTEIYAAALALKTNRPVRVCMSRAEEFSMAVRGPSITRIRSGVSKDGKILARQVETIWDTGAYADCGPTVMAASGPTSPGPYNIPNCKVDSYTVYTNKGISVAYRGYGSQETAFAYECHMDDIARRIGMDPTELRMKNILREGMQNATGQTVVSGGLDCCLEQVKKDLCWETFEKKPLHGRGIAITQKTSAAGKHATCYIRLNEDGRSYHLIMGVSEQGQGSDTAMAQICAEALDVAYEQIYVCPTDTDYTPFLASTTGSRATFIMGNTILEAAKDLKCRITKMAARYFCCDAEKIRLHLREGTAERKAEEGEEGSTKALSAIMQKMHEGRGGSLTGLGEFHIDKVNADANGQTPYQTPFWMFVAQGAEVEIDPMTGEVHICRLAACSDVGKIINKNSAFGQVCGGMIQGTSGGLMEDVITDPGGIIVNANLSDYKMMTVMDLPEDIHIGITENPQPDGPFGAKGMGEGPVAPGSACIVNAVCDALGISVSEAPVLTPETILRLMQKK